MAHITQLADAMDRLSRGETPLDITREQRDIATFARAVRGEGDSRHTADAVRLAALLYFCGDGAVPAQFAESSFDERCHDGSAETYRPRGYRGEGWEWATRDGGAWLTLRPACLGAGNFLCFLLRKTQEEQGRERDASDLAAILWR